MANSLLDFVFVLLRDPDAAACCAADRAQSVAVTHLTDTAGAAVPA